MTNINNDEISQDQEESASCKGTRSNLHEMAETILKNNEMVQEFITILK